MGMQNPEVSQPLDRLSDVFPEGTRFWLEGIRTVTVNTRDYGEGEMVIVKVRGRERELGVWGAYMVVQAKSVQPSDLNQWYTTTRRPVEGFGRGRPVKMFIPAPQTPEVQAAMADDSTDWLDEPYTGTSDPGAPDIR